MIMDVAAVVRGTGARVLQRGADGQLRENELHAADLGQVVGEICIDSRERTRDALFVALPGVRSDGHEFVPEVLRAGARGCLIKSEHAADLAPVLPAGELRYLFVVDDPLIALQRLAASWREAHRATIIGITGSIGKTTSKEIIAGLLATRWSVLRSIANLNTEIGLPLMLLRLAEHHHIVVLEMGMYAAGDIADLARIARPEIGVVTTVEPIHLERLGSLERIARTKSELIAALPTTGLAVLNGDNRWTRAMARTSGVAPALLVGLAPDCDYRAVNVISHGLDGISFRLEAEEDSFPLRTRLPGTHLIHAYLAAAAIGRHMGMSWPEVIDGLTSLSAPLPAQLIHTDGGLLVIDDRYNASPLSMSAALALLADAPGDKIAVLGDMLELGPEEEHLHQEVGAQLAGVADWLITRGSRATWFADGAEAAGFPAARIRRTAGNGEALAAVQAIVRTQPAVTACGTAPRMQRPAEQESVDQWSVLVKGSRGMAMEEIVQGLRGDR